MNVRPGNWSTACAVLLSAAALLTAAPASADPIDDAFVAALVKDGIVIGDRYSEIAMGHTMCAEFDENAKSSVLAVSAYCPQYKGQTDDSLRWMNPGPPLM
jgi:hypothetical protein